MLTLGLGSSFYKRKLPDDESARIVARLRDGQSRDDTVRFWANVLVGADEECWPWMGAAKDTGYGVAFWNGKLERAHRIGYFLAHGEWPGRLLVRHTCDNRICVNGKHLILGTHKQNTADARERGRLSHGPEHGALVSAGRRAAR
jgi:hypothetical protein